MLTNPFTGVSLNLATVDQTFAIFIGGFAISMLAVIAGVLQFVGSDDLAARERRR